MNMTLLSPLAGLRNPDCECPPRLALTCLLWQGASESTLLCLCLLSATSTMSSPFQDAKSPFDRNCPKADVILRTSDNVDFHFPRALLVLVSSFFESLFSDGTPTDTKDGRPIIALHDNSSELQYLLHFSYPLSSPPPFKKVAEIDAVHAIAQKYVMEGVLVSMERAIFASPNIMALDAVPLFCLAARFSFSALATHAARRSLSIRADDLFGTPALSEPMDLLRGPHINRLFIYRREFRQAIKPAPFYKKGSVFVDSSRHFWKISSSSRDYHGLLAMVSSTEQGIEAHRVTIAMIKEVISLLEERPCPETIWSPEVLRAAECLVENLKSCASASCSIDSTASEILKMLYKDVECAFSEVRVHNHTI